MSWLHAVVLGVVQGLTEFVPVSSTAHLRIVSALAGWRDPGAAFTAVTQLGTEAAVLIYFRREIVEILGAWSRSLTSPAARAEPAARLGWFIVLGTLPIAVLGLALQDPIETTFRDLRLIAVTLIAFGLLLGLADRGARDARTMERLTLLHALAIGAAQALALIPGVSRSGGTIGAGLLLGYTRAAAARYSFLLAVPAVFGSGLFELVKVVRDPGVELFSGVETLVATVVAFGVGLVVIAFFLRYLNRGSFLPFVAYRILLGVLLIGLLLAGVVQP